MVSYLSQLDIAHDKVEYILHHPHKRYLIVSYSLVELFLVSLATRFDMGTASSEIVVLAWPSSVINRIRGFPGFLLLTVTSTVTWVSGPDAKIHARRSMLTTRQYWGSITLPLGSSFEGSSVSSRPQKQRYASHLPPQSSVQYVLAVVQATISMEMRTD